MKTIGDLLKEHSFFEGLDVKQLDFIAGCGKNVVFHEGQEIAHMGAAANEFYLLKEGQVALSIEAVSKRPFVFQTLGPKDIVGLSWLIEPYVWTVSATAKTQVRAIAFDGACLRRKCETDPSLGYCLMKHLVKILVVREDAYRLHLLDVYGETK